MTSNIKIIFTGDYYSYPRLASYCTNNPQPELIFGDLLPELKDADISGINIEFPITDSTEAIEKTGPNLKGSVVTLVPIMKAGFNLAYISNNHTLDYGAEGLEDTIFNLEQRNITPIGIEKNLNEARKAYIKETKWEDWLLKK